MFRNLVKDSVIKIQFDGSGKAMEVSCIQVSRKFWVISVTHRRLSAILTPKALDLVFGNLHNSSAAFRRFSWRHSIGASGAKGPKSLTKIKSLASEFLDIVESTNDIAKSRSLQKMAHTN